MTRVVRPQSNGSTIDVLTTNITALLLLHHYYSRNSSSSSSSKNIPSHPTAQGTRPQVHTPLFRRVYLVNCHARTNDVILRMPLEQLVKWGGWPLGWLVSRFDGVVVSTVRPLVLDYSRVCKSAD